MMGFGARIEFTNSRDLINALTLIGDKAPQKAAIAMRKAIESLPTIVVGYYGAILYPQSGAILEEA